MYYEEITLDRPRRLRITWRDAREIERRIGMPTLDIIQNRLARLDLSAISTVAWVALRWEDKALTQEHLDDTIEKKIETGWTIEDFAISLSRVLGVGAGLRKADSNGTDAGKAEGALPA